jgi:ubiquinone/menaquinone biosynthesis C-methylase UbiE
VELTDILRCPRTGNRLRFGDGDSVVHVHGTGVTYPVVDDIVDFCPDVKDKISKAYDACSSRYDRYMAYATSPGMFGKIFDRPVWGFSGDGGITDEVLSHLPAEFDGVLLDVPVGTGLFTCSRYAGFPRAAIVAVDYSMGMLRKARKRFLEHGVGNVHLLRADVTDLPVADDVVDIVLSMAGLHAFRDKQGAIKEMRRVLRAQGTLLADCYVRGVRRRADWIIRHILARRGFFTPPFLNIDAIASELEGFTVSQQGTWECGAWFQAVKK